MKPHPTIIAATCIIGTAIVTACQTSPPSASTPFDKPLLEAGRDYASWTRVSDFAHIAPTLCRAAQPVNQPVVSESNDATTHGRKLYFLYIRSLQTNADEEGSPPEWDYSAVERGQPIGQTLVKQSWSLPDNLDPTDILEPGLHMSNFFVDGTRRKQGPLFMMHKLDPNTPGTDQGWIYATLTPDGTRVTQSGRIASCMKCHTGSQTVDRLFGPSWKRR